MDSQFIPAHLKCVQEESKICLSSIQKNSHDSHSNDLASHLFTLTLTNNGPDLKSSANKLWHSCANYQESSPSGDIVSGSLDPLPFSDITKSLSCHSLNSPIPSSHPNSLCCRISKKDGCHHSHQALSLLSNIEACANQCFHFLLDPSDNSITEVTNELRHLCPALDNITWKTDFVNSHKKEVTATLDKLELEVKARQPPCPSSKDPEPVHVNNEHMAIVAQASLFIRVVCSIMMGVSQCSGNFIISTLTLLLSLAFQQLNRRLSMSHKNTIHCHCTYAPSYLIGSAVPTYPEYCTHYLNPETLCGKPLLDTQSSGACLLKKTFIYHDFNNYLTGLLSRSNIKMMIDMA
ncbi:hypothetical protein V8B97DRAFT_2022635 [Scleroderma yunnanense]